MTVLMIKHVTQKLIAIHHSTKIVAHQIDAIALNVIVANVATFKRTFSNNFNLYINFGELNHGK